MEIMDRQHTTRASWAGVMQFLLRIRNTMDYLVLIFMLLYFSAILFDWCAPKQIFKKRYLSMGLLVPHNLRQIFCCDQVSFFILLSKLSQCLAEVFHSSRAKLSRGAPELLILRLLAAPKLPNLSLFREVRRKSGL